MKPSHVLDSCSGKFQPKQIVFTEKTTAVRNRRYGSMLDALDGTSLAKMSLSAAKTVLQEHPTPFVRSRRHSLSVLRQAHSALQVAPAGGPHNEPLVTNLERATKLLHITPVCVQSPDECCSRQALYNAYTRLELVGLIDWLAVFVERMRQKSREDRPEAHRAQASKLAHERRGTTEAAGDLISSPKAP